LGEEHPDTLTSRNNLALVLRGLGRLEEAEAEHRAELEICRRVLGEEHPDTLTSRHNLATVLRDLGRQEEAAALENHPCPGATPAERLPGPDMPPA
jgi:hypothetical protein